MSVSVDPSGFGNFQASQQSEIAPKVNTFEELEALREK